jgi:hypothetical protein
MKQTDVQAEHPLIRALATWESHPATYYLALLLPRAKRDRK